MRDNPQLLAVATNEDEMNQDQFGGLVRNILIPVGAFMAAHGLAAGAWDGISGLILAAAMFGWAGFTHEETQDLLLSLVRGAIGAIGGYLVQVGWASSDQVTLYSGFAAMIVPNIWTWFANRFPDLIASGKKASFAVLALLVSPLSLKVAIALTAAGTLSACAAYDSFVSGLPGKLATGIANVNTSLLATNQALAAAAPSVGSLLADIQVADGYFNQIAATGVISPAALKVEAKVMVAVNAIQANPPTSVAAVAAALAAAKTNIQNLSQVPTAAQGPVTVPVVAIPATSVSAAVPATTIVAPVPVS